MPEKSPGRVALISISFLPLATLDAGAAIAQDQPQPQTAGVAAEATLKEVVVTAQKRAENVQSVPISIAVISSRQLADSGIDMAKSLAAVTPDMSIDFNTNFVAPYIRGVGTQYANPGLEPSVATYLDDLYLSRASAGLLSFFDVQRVEVLKGPQGTLYGMNTTGGPIRIITKDPTPDFQAGVGVTAGNIGTLGGQAYISGPVASGLDGRLAVQYDHNDGYVTDVNPGAPHKLENRNLGAVRAKLYWSVNDKLSVKLMADYENKLDHEGQAFLSLYPGAPEVTGAALGGVPSTGFYTTSDNYDPSQKMHLRQGSAELRVDHDAGTYTLSSITGYVYSGFTGYADLDTTSLPLINANTLNELSKDWSEELQAVSTASGRFHWVGGLFYWHEGGEHNFGISGLGIDAGTGIPNSFAGGLGRVALDTLGPYGQISYKLTSKWEVLVGARYSVYHAELKNNQFYLTTTTTPEGFDPAGPYLATANSGPQQFNSNTLAPKTEVI